MMMEMQIKAREFKTGAEIIAARDALRARFLPVAKRVIFKPQNIAAKVIVFLPAKSKAGWTVDEKKRAAVLWNSGKSAAEIGAQLDRSKYSIYDIVRSNPDLFLSKNPIKKPALPPLDFSIVTTFSGEITPAKYALPSQDVAFIGAVKPRRMLIQEIAEMVLERYPGITMEMIKGGNRAQKLCIPRFEIFHTVKTLRPDVSFPMIGRAFNRDHTTVLNGIRKHKERMGIT